MHTGNINGSPLENHDIIADPANNFVVIMKDGKIYKNTLQLIKPKLGDLS